MANADKKQRAGAAEAMATQKAPEPAVKPQLGNDERISRLKEGKKSRKGMMRFIREHLGMIEEAQKREVMAASPREMREWRPWIEDGTDPNYTEPKPMRWRESARLYEEAARHLCRGQVSRGAEVLEAAIREEQRAFEKVSEHVDMTDLDEEGLDTSAFPFPRPLMGYMEAPPKDYAIPEDIRDMADRIQRCQTDPKIIPVAMRMDDPFWFEEEEEEEEKPGDGAGG